MAVKTTFLYQNNIIVLDEDIKKNVLSINNVDYYVCSINPQFGRNKGANSFVFKLYPCQDFVDAYNSVPQKVIKVSKYFDLNNGDEIEDSEYNQRFRDEIEALKDCKSHHINNIIEIDYDDHIVCSQIRKNFRGKEIKKDIYFPFYMMDYAEGDLKTYLEENKIDKSAKLDLCLQLAEGLNDLNRLNYYHRDIKPDNILFFGNQWKIGDLGLVAHRDRNTDDINEFIGPKGWLSPEAMNKYLAEGRCDKMIDCKIDHQSDIFQIGKVFWYILQGNAPIGCIKRSDFLEKDDSIYVLIRTMLNYSKKRRIKDISYVVKELERIIDKTL